MEGYYTYTKFSDLLGKTLVSIKRNDDTNSDTESVEFITDTGESYMMNHSQDCCESVRIEDIVGDLQDLVGSPILMADEATSDNHGEDSVESYDSESCTWTFYKLATIKGYVTIRWYGSSNGYYSEDVSFYVKTKGEK